MALDTLARAMAARADSKAKTAYQYAVEGGYTGTEEQFTEDMGNLGINADAVNNAVRFDISQSKTDAQKLQAQANIGLDTTDGDINAQLALRALITGYYEAMGVGTADNLTSSQRVTDEEPYNYRTAGGSADVGSQENFKSLVGGTLALNQMFNKTGFPATTTNNGIKFTNNGDGSISLSGEATALATLQVQMMYYIPNHVYAYFGLPSGENATEWFIRLYVYGSTYKTTTASGIEIFKAGNDYAGGMVNIYVRQGFDADAKPVTIKPIMVDLTALFGTIPQTVGQNSYNSIADYVYSLGNTNGIAWLYKYFPILNGGYVPYSAPNLGSVCCDKHITTGLNLEPKPLALGYQWNSSGVYTQASDNKACATNSKIRVFPNTEYCVSVPNITATASLYRAEFGIDGNFLRRVVGSDKVDGTLKYGTFTTSADAYFVGWYLYRGTVFTADEITESSFNLEYDGEMNGVYEPYEANTYDMGHETLRGIYMLDSFGNLFLDPSKNDTKTPDGEITRRRKYYKFVGNESEEWYMTTNSHGINVFNKGIVGKEASSYDVSVARVLCDKFTPITYGYASAETYNGTIAFTSGRNAISVVPPVECANASAFTTWLASNNVEVEYELDTPTTENGTEYTELQKCHNLGTENLTDYEVEQGNRVVSIPVGHVTEYPVDLKAKLEMLPSAPLEDGDYLCRVVNGEAQFVPIGTDFPDMPTTDGTFTLKATVSSGTATLSWVADT